VRRLLALLVALGAALAVAPGAQAALDPTHAQKDVKEAMAEKAYPFCSKPREPLSSRARELCPAAGQIPNCEGFAAACAKASASHEDNKEESRRRDFSGPWKAILSALGMIAQALVWLVVAALILAVLIPIARALLRVRREKEDEAAPDKPATAGAAEPVALPVSDEEMLLRRAGELAARGENAAALELYFAASLRALEKRGALRVAPYRTNGEYVRACLDAAAKPPLYDIAREVDRVKFGGGAAGAAVVEGAARRALAIVRAAPVAMLALALLLSTGCGGLPGLAPHPGDDPAGLELFREVLHRQGVAVEPLRHSLASLPLPGHGEGGSPPGAVIVDVERTPLDEDTSAHLVEWVDAGGVLVLAGAPHGWPKEFAAASATSCAHKVTARTLVGREDADEDDDDSALGAPKYAKAPQHGELAMAGRGLEFRGSAERAAWLDDDSAYAAVLAHGRGSVVGIATDELLTNAGLARSGNAAVMIAILSNAGRQRFAIAESDDGVTPPSTPLASMMRAGLGTGLVHALVACLVLFLAAGVRLARPRPFAPSMRRAFAEHIQAVGALYGRTRNAPHALSAYARFADERLRARLPRQGGDVAAFLASRAGVPLERCRRIWARATEAKSGAPAQGDELSVLGELAALYTTATEQKP
jgi:hypothetical protein